MKQMKFLVAILAIGFVVVGSSFTKKAVLTKEYGFISKTLTSSSPDLYTYRVVNLDEVTGESCIGSTNVCKVTIDITGKTINEISNSEFADVLGVNPNTDVSETPGILFYNEQ